MVEILFQFKKINEIKEIKISSLISTVHDHFRVYFKHDIHGQPLRRYVNLLGNTLKFPNSYFNSTKEKNQPPKLHSSPSTTYEGWFGFPAAKNVSPSCYYVSFELKTYDRRF